MPLTVPADTLPSNFADQGLLGLLRLVVEQTRAEGDTALPSEAWLCRRLGLSKSVLHRLLQSLAVEGLIFPVRGKGWFLQPPKLEIPLGPHASYAGLMRDLGKEPRSEILSVDQERAKDDFWADPELWLWSFDFRRYHDDQAVSLARVHLRQDLTPGLHRLLGPDASLTAVLADHYGIASQRRRTWCEAVAADVIVGDALRVPVGSPLLRLTHWADWQGKPFELTVNYLRADACRVRVDYEGGTA